MKAGARQDASPGATGNQSITDANISNDYRCLISFGGMATANHTLTAHASFGMGFTDGTASCAVAALYEDGQNPTDCRSFMDDGYAYAIQGLNSSTTTAECAPNAVLSTGVQLNWTDIDTAQLVNHLLLSGSDLTAKVRTAVLNGTTPVTVTHGLGGTPDVIIAIHHGGADGALGSGSYSYGWWVRDDAVTGGVKYGQISGRNGHAATTVACIQRTSVSKIASYHTGTSPVYSVTIQNAGATTFEVVADSATTNLIGFLCLRGISATTGLVTLPTGTGSTALISGLPSAAKTVFFLQTQNTSAVETSSTTDTAGVFGLGVAVNNNGTIQQMSACMSSDDGIVTPSTSIEKSQISNTQAIRILDNAGVPDIEGAVTGMTTSITTNFTNAGAAVPLPYLVLMNAATAPSFAVAPSVSSQTATAYTLSATPTLNGATSATWYSVAVRRGTATPSSAQIIAGFDGTGAAALAANSKSITGADTLVLTALASRPHPVSDIHSVLVTSGGTSAVSSLSTKYLSAPAGFGFQEVTSLTVPTDAKSFLTELSPAAALGHVLQVQLLTEPNGFSRTVGGNGVPVIAAGGVRTWQRLAYDRYSTTTWTWDGTDYAYINNTAPTASAPPERLLERNETPTDNFNLNAYITDPDVGDVRTFALTAGPDIPGMTIAPNGTTPGIPLTVGNYIQTIRATDQAGAYVDLSHIVTVEDRELVPSVIGMLPTLAISVLTNAGFVIGDQLLTQDVTKPNGVVVSQNPAALSNIIVGSAVHITINSLTTVPPVEIDDITVAHNTGSYGLDVTTLFSEAVELKGFLPNGWSFANRIFTYLTNRVGTFGPFIFKDTHLSSAEFTITVTPTPVVTRPRRVLVTFGEERSKKIRIH